MLLETAGDEGGYQLYCHVHVVYACLYSFMSSPTMPLPTGPRARKRATLEHSTALTVIEHAWAQHGWPSVSVP